MNFSRVLLAGGLLAALPAWAVYAPVPEQDLGKPLTIATKAGLSYDTNIFGGADHEIGSSVFEFSPKVAYNASLTEKTFLSLSYQLTLDHYDNRPGEKLLDSHALMARIAHAISPSSTVDVVGLFRTTSSPESLLQGLPVNTDQSSRNSELDASYTASPLPKLGLTAKLRTTYTKYRNATLGRSLDHYENLYGLAGDYAVLPDLKAVAEYRHQDVYYDKLGESKNKHSDYLMGGLDYQFAKTLTASGRVGLEWRRRAAERSSEAPYAELSVRYAYAEDSFLSGGYMLTLEEGSDLVRFTDTRVNRFFVSAQHHLTPLIVASASLNFEPSVLRGRRGFANVDEDATRGGFALTYLPTKNWTVSAGYDYDYVHSDDASRSTKRNRTALNASYTF